MATPVQITVTVDSNGAVTGFQQIGGSATTMGQQVATAGLKGAEAVAALTKQWEAEQAAIADVNARIKENMAAQEAAGAAAAAAAKKAADEAQKAAAADEAFRNRMFAATARAADQAARQFQGFTNEQAKASVTGRLLEQQLGLSNRALNQVASRSALLGPVMAAMFPIGVAAAFVPMMIHVGESIASAAQEAGGMTEAVKKMQAETVQASKDAFLSPVNLDVLRQHLAEVNAEIAANERLNATFDERLKKYYEEETLGQSLLRGDAFTAEQEKVQTVEKDKQVELERQRIELLKQEAALVRQAAVDQAMISATSSGLHGFAKLKFDEAAAIDALEKDKSLDAIQRASKEYAVRYEFSQKRIELERQESDKVISLRHSVTDETLTGINKIYADEAFAIDQATKLQQRNGTSYQDLQRTKVLLHQKALNEIAAYDRQQAEATKTLENEAVLSGLDGDAKIIMSAEQRADKERELYARGIIDYATMSARIVAIDKVRNDQILANDQAEAEKSQKLLDKRTLEMQKEAEDQRDALAAAALASVPPWQRAYAQIEVEAEKRLRQIDEEERKALLQYQDDAAARVQITAMENAKRQQVYAETNERIHEENKRLTESLGSDLQSVFDDITSGNIGKRILANMEKLFFQILAQWILSLNLMKSAAGSIFGSIVFGPQSTGANVFGGGSGGGSLFGGLLGGLFGGSSSQSAQIGIGAGAPAGGVAIPGLVGATPSGLGGAIAGTGATANSALVPSASSALTSSTMSAAIPGLVGGTTSQVAGKSSLFSGLLSAKGLASLAPMAAMLLGAAGGKVGMAGGILGSLLLSGHLAPVLSSLYGSIGLGATGALAGGAVGGLLGFGIGSSQGGLLGSLAGAGSGALTGFMVGGPIGAVVGGLIGLLGGIFGGIFGGAKRKKQANALADNTIIPDITQIVTGFDGFQVDQGSAIQQLEQLRTDAQKQLSALKSQGKDVFNQKVSPAIDNAEKHIRDTQAERDRRSSIVFGPPQFDTGGLFRTMRGNAGLAVLHDGEMVINPTATKKNAATLASINAGGTAAGAFRDLHIHAAGPVDRKYIMSRQFQKDFLDAQARWANEGNL